MHAYPQLEGKFIVDTDASNVGIGGVLSQVQDGQERVISYYSKTLSKAEKNYCVTRRELLAIVKSLEHFHKYIYGQEFHLRTNMADEFQELGGADRPLDLAPAGVQLYFRAPSRQKAQQCRRSFPTAMPRRMMTLSKI
jgi:hypothetical protein